MYKILTILSLLIGIISTIKAQKKPFFEFTLYAEDSKGHKDSVVIGYAKDVDVSKPLDSSYLDRGITTKFDSVFEIRAHRFSYIYVHDDLPQNEKLSKHLTVRYINGENTCNIDTNFHASRFAFVAIKCKYPPVKFYWDKTAFNNPKFICLNESILVSDEYILQEYQPDASYVAPYRRYLAKDNVRTDSLKEPFFSDYGWRLRYKDNTFDTLQANYVIQFRGKVLTGVSDIIQSISKSYPNPCREQLNVLLPVVKSENLVVNIHGVNGYLMQATHKFRDGIVSIDTSPLSIGEYIVEVITANKQRFSGKFVKIE
jgi:hypothetical protein